MLGRHLDVVMIPTAVGILILDPQVGEVDLIVEVREIVFMRPRADFLVGPIGVSVVIRALVIPFVEPGLVLTLELVVEHDAVNPRATLRQALRRTFVRAIDLEVMFALPFAFKAIPKGLTGTMVAVSMTFEQRAAPLRQRHRVLTRSGDTSRLNQPLLAEVPKVA